MQDGQGKVIPAPDSYYLLKHLMKYSSKYAHELAQAESVMFDHAKILQNLRNKLAHATLGDGFIETEVRTGLHFAQSLASASRLVHVQENVHRLSQQYDNHLKSKRERIRLLQG